jgi:hypothetical protein
MFRKIRKLLKCSNLISAILILAAQTLTLEADQKTCWVGFYPNSGNPENPNNPERQCKDLTNYMHVPGENNCYIIARKSYGEPTGKWELFFNNNNGSLGSCDGWKNSCPKGDHAENYGTCKPEHKLSEQ